VLSTPTGSEKVGFFKLLLASVKNEETNGCVVVLVISPLSAEHSGQDQVNKMNGGRHQLNCSSSSCLHNRLACIVVFESVDSAK